MQVLTIAVELVICDAAKDMVKPSKRRTSHL